MTQAQRPSWRSWAWPVASALLVLLPALLFVLPVSTGLWRAGVLASILAVMVIGWAWWQTWQQRAAYERRLERWARERAVMTERLKIARELHDLASHGLGVVTVRAATAKFADEQERALALEDIEQVGRRSTDQLRRMLTVLRSADGAASLHSPAGTTNLRQVIESARRDGVAVETDIDEQILVEVSPQLQLTICAVVGEALSNTLRHAGPTTATMRLQRARDGIGLEVCDLGPVAAWQSHPGTGYGLAGVAERVALYQGNLTTGPHGTGFRLAVYLPMGPAR
ncbi:sensor histidine kinase [Tsukamurella tyrosinosolvens]|uniref:sensor histidine kinase n=1 Tax=Tsukamurella tyrosinosolvens TaxID=57704 RepID=UPI000DF6F6EA|nr:histidine kinase [Tsukamurella tyrosinosolvens]RDB49104.1 histidine kinase [Tsukamurella tyrosinosolvens]